MTGRPTPRRAIDRRHFLVGSGVVLATTWASGALRGIAEVGAAVSGSGPYGTLGPVDANGLQLPAGFTSRIVATTGVAMGASSYPWHAAPDGGACFGVAGGGWVYVSNSEVGLSGGGASAIRFAPDGTIVDAYRILGGTSKNCAGGPTPWGTWLSCEENGPSGRVYECSPGQAGQGVRRDALGSFNHEAAAVDTATGALFLTEDDPVGRLYKFVPTTAGSLSGGSLYAAAVSGTSVTWIPTSDNAPDRAASTTPFNGGEGIWAHNGSVYFVTKGDRRIWKLVPATNTLTLVHDCAASPSALTQVDNITVHPASGDLFVAEDGGNMELCILGLVGGVEEIAAFCRINGHAGSEVTGPAFSPDGTRLYLSSQRGADGSTGVTYEITGPFRTGAGGPTPTVRTLPVAADTYVRGGTYATTGYGAINLLQVSANTSPTYERISYLAVDLASLTGAVTDAVLRLTARVASGALSTLEVLGVSDVSWTEAATNWNNRPALGPVLDSFALTTTGATWYEADVSEWVAARQAAGATRVAFAVRMTQSVGLAAINSRENTSGRPELVVTVADGPPPPNNAPAASFTESIAGLTVTVTSTATDSDGSIASHAWNFGDGSTAVGPLASHTYAASGTFPITLTVTDDDGAPASTSRSVTVTAPPAGLIASDTFSRTTTNGLGSADTGGAWTIAGTAANFAVNGGQGRVTVPTVGGSRAATLLAASARDVEVTTTFSLDKLPAGSGSFQGVTVRKVGNTEYRLRVRTSGTSSVLQLLRVVNGAESAVASATLPGVYVAGTPIHLRFRVVGTGSTQLSGRAWFGAATEPSTWQIQTTDTTTQLQGAGGIGLHLYVSSSASNVPVVLSVDTMEARPAA